MRTRCLWLLLLCTSVAAAGPHPPGPLAAAETLYADWLDATYAVSTLRAGPDTRLAGRDADGWEARRRTLGPKLARALAAVDAARLDGADQQAVAAMRKGFANAPEAPAAAAPGASQALCLTAGDPGLDRAALSAALYACFEHHGNHLRVGDGTIVRSTALELLQTLADGGRRRAIFEAFAPLWSALNGADEGTSPYRRLVQLAANEAAARGSGPIADAARTVGATPAAVESWLVALLEAWRDASDGPAVEPWDYWYAHAAASRALDGDIPRERILELTRRFYHDLGADLDALGVRHDLAVRPGKAPLAYADFVRIGRATSRGWRPAIARVSANVEEGGLFVLNEIVHEDGHAVHMAAVRTRPAFFDLGDDLFIEAFADVTSWSVVEPAWQRRYLGRAADERALLEALYANVMLDVAWGLFELQLLAAPSTDPNELWSDITSRYLHVVPHPELPWWALRVQLVDAPGYMINYGLGAVLTADLRRRTREAIGSFDAGNAEWYRFTAEHLLRFGTSIETPALLQRFLGRPVSTAALLAELGRLRAPGAAAAR